jgi:DNA primase large subunit
MDTLLAARYPFLSISSKFAEDNNADLFSLLASDSYVYAKKRGVERIIQSMESHNISEVALMGEYERLMEILSYPYARMLVSMIDDRFLTKKYVLGEATKLHNALKKDSPDASKTVSLELDIKLQIEENDKLSIPFSDYLVYSNTLKAIEWKLINADLKNGRVFMNKEKSARILQIAFQEKIDSEIPLKIPEELKKYLQKDVDYIIMVLSELKNRLNPTGGNGINIEYLPPCMKTILANAQNGMNLPHSARFALVSYLNALGANYDEIISLFSQSPDFDESKSSYQIKHITGELSGTEGYTSPECSTMKTYGLCFEPDEVCMRNNMNHPLNYYRIKSGNFRRPEKEE